MIYVTNIREGRWKYFDTPVAEYKEPRCNRLREVGEMMGKKNLPDSKRKHKRIIFEEYVHQWTIVGRRNFLPHSMDHYRCLILMLVQLVGVTLICPRCLNGRDHL